MPSNLIRSILDDISRPGFLASRPIYRKSSQTCLYLSRHTTSHKIYGTQRPPMEYFLDPYRAALALTAAIQFVLFLRWLYRRIRNDELLRIFVEDMATNHLPHIYER